MHTLITGGTFERKYNAVDRDITAACKFAEKACSRPSYGFPNLLNLPNVEVPLQSYENKFDS
jgi:hypothetical protein